MRGKINKFGGKISTTHSHLEWKIKTERPKDGTNHKKNNLKFLRGWVVGGGIFHRMYNNENYEISLLTLLSFSFNQGTNSSNGWLFFHLRSRGKFF